MAELLIREIDESLVNILKERANRNGRSVEEEHCLILREVLSEKAVIKGAVSLKEYLLKDPVEDLEFPHSPTEYPPEIQSLA